MKQLKSFTLSTALFILSACSASGNGGNTGGNGEISTDPYGFLTAISGYSGVSLPSPNSSAFIISTDGKQLIFTDEGANIYTLTFVKSLSATKAQYHHDPELLKLDAAYKPIMGVEIKGDKIELENSVVWGTAGKNVTANLIRR